MSDAADEQPKRIFGAAACCSGESRAAGESMEATAPTARAWLFVQYDGAWGRDAVADSTLELDLKVKLLSLEGVRVQLIRRHGRAQPAGVRVYAAWVGEGGPWIESTVADSFEQLQGIDLEPLAAGQTLGWARTEEPLFFVCTNGRRDVCCAELGRPVVAALKAYWPESTWETTHLGGHRFAGTMVAFPWGVAMGRLDQLTAYTACQALIDGHLPTELMRGYLGSGQPAS